MVSQFGDVHAIAPSSKSPGAPNHLRRLRVCMFKKGWGAKGNGLNYIQNSYMCCQEWWCCSLWGGAKTPSKGICIMTLSCPARLSNCAQSNVIFFGCKGGKLTKYIVRNRGSHLRTFPWWHTSRICRLDLSSVQRVLVWWQ